MDLEKLFVYLFGVSLVPSRKAHLNLLIKKDFTIVFDETHHRKSIFFKGLVSNPERPAQTYSRFC